MPTDFTNGIVAFYGNSGPVGAGFVVSAEGLILTCSHVLDQAGWSFQAWDEPVQVRFKANGRFADALVQEGCFSPQTEGDYALLALQEEAPAEVVVLSLWPAAAAAGHATAMFGFPAGFGDGLRGEGGALGLVQQDGRAILQLRSTETTRGYSGGPVWHPVWQRVIGMVMRGTQADALGRLAFTSFAVSVEALVQACPDRLTLTPPESNIARATQDIAGASEDLVQSYTARPFVGRDAALERLDAWLAANDRGRMIVTAPAGFGKTALLAHWLRRRQASGDFIAFHIFSNRDEFLRPLANAYANLLGQLAIYYGLPDETLPDIGARPARFRAMIDEHNPAAGQRLIILLDALDECERPFQLPLPIEMPRGVYLVASARSARLHDQAEPLPYLDGWTADADSVHLDRLPQVALAGWLAAVGEGALLEESRDPDFVARLAQVSDGYPLYLRYLLEDLVEARRAGRPVEDVLEEPAATLGGYVRARLRAVASSLGRDAEKFQDLFILLAVARYALREDELLALTALSPFDLSDLPVGLTRWLNIGRAADDRALYSFAHARLAYEFETALRGAARAKRDQLIDWCAAFADHHKPFALRHYPGLLLEAGRYETLYDLVYDEAYAAAQAQHLPAESELNLQVVRLALEAAAAQGDAARMTQFLLEHGRRVLALRRASPLEVLRSNAGPIGLAGAWSLADANDAEVRLSWLLLLAWELAGDGRTEDVEATLARLTPDRLSTLTQDWPYATLYLLVRLLPAWTSHLLPVAEIVLDDRAKSSLCQRLGRAGHWDAALALAQTMRDEGEQADTLRRLVYQQCGADLPDEALVTAAAIDLEFPAALARRRIAERLAETDRPDEALEIANDLPFDGLRAGALGWIAVAYGRNGSADRQETCFDEALALAGPLADPYDRCLAHKDIAVALHEAGRHDQSQESFTVAVAMLNALDDPDRADTARRQLALARAWTGHVVEALTADAGFQDADLRFETLHDMADIFAEDGNFGAALAIAALVDDVWDRSWILDTIAREQARAGDFDAALDVIGDMAEPGTQIWALAEVALIQFEADLVDDARETLAIAMAQSDHSSYPEEQARDYVNFAAIQAAMGDEDGARASRNRALEIALEVSWNNSRDLRLDIVRGQARAGDLRAARDTLSSVLAGGHSLQEPANGDQVLEEIALIQIEAGHFEAARDSTGWIIPARDRAQTLLRLAIQQAEPPVADPAGAAASFDLAIEAVDQMEADDYPSGMLFEIGNALAQVGLFEDAWRTNDMIDDVELADRIRYAMVESLIGSGDLEEAARVAGEVEQPEPAAVTHAALAAGHFNAGDRAGGEATFQRALELAGYIKYDMARALALTKVGATLAAKGRDAEAALANERAAGITTEMSPSASTFTALAVALDLAMSGQIDAALQYYDRLESAEMGEQLLQAVSKRQAQDGDYEAARQTAARLERDRDRVEALVAAATHAADAGATPEAGRLLHEALEISRGMSDNEHYYQSLSQIAAAQVRAGQTVRAVRTAGSIQSAQGVYLPPIARALAAAGDLPRLTQLLQLCAQDPHAALSAVPAIAQYAPDQAPAIAQIVARHSWS